MRFLAPYALVSLALVIAAGVGYGSDAIGVPATYGITALAVAIATIGAARWELRRPPRQR